MEELAHDRAAHVEAQAREFFLPTGIFIPEFFTDRYIYTATQR
jgi:hypothetical protein